MVTYRSSFYTDNLQEIGIFLIVLLHNFQLVKREGNSVFNSTNGEIFRNVLQPDNPELEQCNGGPAFISPLHLHLRVSVTKQMWDFTSLERVRGYIKKGSTATWISRSRG